MNKNLVIAVLCVALAGAIGFGVYQKLRADRQQALALERLKLVDEAREFVEKTQEEMKAQQEFNKGGMTELLKQLEASKKRKKKKR